MNPSTYYLLDVFTDQIFGGNPLAIFPDARELDSALFQRIAFELSLSETVFLFPPDNKGENHSMRIFTPRKELPTAGHPTIGTAFFLATQTSSKEIELNQKVGTIKVEVSYIDNEPDILSMYQPLPEFGKVFQNREEIARMLSLQPYDLDEFPIQAISCGNNFLYIPLKNVEALSKARVNMALWDELDLAQVELYPFTTQGVVNGDVKGRMFAPGLGIAEDPATGSANGPLGCYLSRYTDLKFPVTSLQGFEMGRPSYLYLDITKDEKGEINMVKVSGKSKFVGKGELFLPGR